MTIATQSAVSMPPVRQTHEGTYAVTFRHVLNGSSLSVSDLVVMGYIAPNVKIVDAFIWGQVGDGAPTFRVGTIATDNAIMTATTMTAGGVNRTGFIPVIISLSADAEGNLRVPIAITKAAGTSTVTGSINLCLLMQSPPV